MKNFFPFPILIFCILISGIAKAQVDIEPDSVCAGSNGIQYLVQSTTGSTYQWWVTGSGHTIHQDNSNQITIDWALTAGVDTVKVLETTSKGCPGDTVKIAVLRILPPTVDAGSDAAWCAIGGYTLSASAQNYATLTWTTSGDGGFSDNSDPLAVYTPGTNDIINGTVTLTLTASSNIPCSGDVIDAMVLSITPPVQIEAGADVSICAGNTIALTGSGSSYASILWTTSGTGTFDDATSLTPIYTPSSVDTASGSVVLTMTAQPLSPCTDVVMDALTVTIIPAATVNAGNDAEICWNEGTYYLTSAIATNISSVLWTTSGDGSFADASIVNAYYTPSAADIANGSVTLTLTVQGNAPCSEAVDSIVITINAKPLTSKIFHY
ncbi:MAG: hypothetical protein Q7J34_10010 [Bacteroidales bacterium]|nr:hypothetical protein [Bacteroidales bacterium]